MKHFDSYMDRLLVATAGTTHISPLTCPLLHVQVPGTCTVARDFLILNLPTTTI